MVFGEIVEPSSRALWDFDLEEDFENETLTLDWKGNFTVPEKVNVLLIADTKFLCKFLENSIVKEDSNIVCTLRVANLSIYNLGKDNYLLLCELPQDFNANEVTQKLQPWIKAAKTLIGLTTTLITSYHHDNKKKDEFCFIRSLAYKINVNNKIYPRLETPNLVTGYCTSIFTYCTFIDKPCQLYIAYVDGRDYDSLNCKPILNLLDTLKVTDILKIKVTNNMIDSSNLYM